MVNIISSVDSLAELRSPVHVTLLSVIVEYLTNEAMVNPMVCIIIIIIHGDNY